MFVTLLTKSGGLLSPISSLLGLIMNGIYEFFHLFGIENIALSIFVFTLIAKLLMLPLTIKQQKFTKLQSVMNPELQKITSKYKGKKDEASLRKQQTETQAVYEKYGVSPTSGCLPMLITLPIMFALYGVINNIPAYVNEVKSIYENVAEAIKTTDAAYYIGELTKIAEGTRVNVAKFSEVSENVLTNNHIIDVLAQFGTDKWNQLIEAFPTVRDTIHTNFEIIRNVNEFFGLNITNAPGWKFPGIIIPILAMLLQFVQSKQLTIKNKDANKDNPAASAMSSMNIVMPIMSGVFCIALPIGVGLYWIANSAFSIVQQFFVNKYMDRVNVDELIENSVKNAGKRKKRSRVAEGTSVSLQEMAKKQTKSIETAFNNQSPKNNEASTADNANSDGAAQDTGRQKSNPGSISEIANILKNRSSEKGEK